MTQTTPSSRQDWMGLLARARPARLADLLASHLPELPRHDLLRGPEIGAVMVQGRMGGTGGAFHLGEMTMTRCSVRVGDLLGHAHVQGRDRDHARHAAVLDALLQGPQALALQRAILDPLRREEAARRAALAAKAEATKVEFFTLMRGEDK